MIFNQALPHGNTINEENETRVSLNCRFKSLFSPYGDKKLGEFFEPIIIRPATKIGIDYKDPKKKKKQEVMYLVEVFLNPEFLNIFKTW